MIKFRIKGAALCALSVSAALAFLGGTVYAGELVINVDTSDPAPKKMIEELVADFEAAHPDVQVKLNIFDHEGYKTSIRNFLTADAPDIAAWYAGNKMAPYVKARLFEDVSDVWAKVGSKLKSTKAAMAIDANNEASPTHTTSGASTTGRTYSRNLASPSPKRGMSCSLPAPS